MCAWIKFRSVFERYEASELNQIDAAALLGVSERTFRRWCVRFEDGGEAGLLDRRLGQASGRRVPPEQERQIETLYRTRSRGFTAKHFCQIDREGAAVPRRQPRDLPRATLHRLLTTNTARCEPRLWTRRLRNHA